MARSSTHATSTQWGQVSKNNKKRHETTHADHQVTAAQPFLTIVRVTGIILVHERWPVYRKHFDVVVLEFLPEAGSKYNQGPCREEQKTHPGCASNSARYFCGHKRRAIMGWENQRSDLLSSMRAGFSGRFLRSRGAQSATSFFISVVSTARAFELLLVIYGKNM